MTDAANTTATVTERDLLNEVFRNTRMSADSLLDLLPHAKDEKFRKYLTEQITRYEAYSTDATKELEKLGEKPSGENPIAKISAKMGTFWHTVMDSGTPHLAQMVLEGTTMGVGELLRIIRNAENSGVSGASLELARNVCSYEERVTEQIKEFMK